MKMDSSSRHQHYSHLFQYVNNKEYPKDYSVLQKRVLRKKAKYFTVKDGELYCNYNFSRKVIYNQEDQLSAIEKAHVSPHNGHHYNSKTTLHNLCDRYQCYWKGIVSDVKKFVNNCVVCQNKWNIFNTDDADSDISNHRWFFCHSKSQNKIWETVFLQVIGPFFQTEQQNEFVVVMVDPVSKWIEAKPLVKNSSDEVASFIFSVFIRLGFCHCKCIGFDSSFVAEIQSKFRKLCDFLQSCVFFEATNTIEKLQEPVTAKESSKCSSTKNLSKNANQHKGRRSADIQKTTKPPSSVTSACGLISSEARVSLNCDFLDSLFQEVVGNVESNGTQNMSTQISFDNIFPKFMKDINILIETFPLTWDEKLPQCLFQLRTMESDNDNSSPFYKMFGRHPFPVPDVNKHYCSDSDSDYSDIEQWHLDSEDSDVACDDIDRSEVSVRDESPGSKSAVIVSANELEVMKNFSSSPKTYTRIPATKSTPITVISENKATPILNSTPLSQRYSLRTTLKAKGPSSVIERVLKLSAAKRNCPVSEETMHQLSPKKAKRNSNVLSKPSEKEQLVAETQLDIANEMLPSDHQIETDMVIEEREKTIASPERENSSDTELDISASKDEISSKETEEGSSISERDSTEPVYLKVFCLPKSESAGNEEGSQTDEQTEETDQPEVTDENNPPPNEIHVTIVAADNAEDEAVAESSGEMAAKPRIEKSLRKRGRIPGRKKKKKRLRKLATSLPHKCPQCPATYLATPEELKLHMECHIPGQRLLQCPHCPKSVRSWSHIQRHLATHEDLAPYLRPLRSVPEDKRRCRFCEKVFTTREGMLRHEQVIHVGEHRFECTICGRKYKERKTFKRHMDIHANVIYKCEHCRYKTKIKRNFIEHKRIHDGRGYQCEVCSKIFTKQSILLVHMEIHNDKRNPAICDQCGMKLANVGSLRQHIRNMHDTPGHHPCDQCNYVGKTKANLCSHIDRAHNKPFKCEKCSYSCKSEKALNRHVDIFHNETERRFACTLCPYRARDCKQLSEHTRFRHNPNALRFPCSYCNMKFKTMTMLRHHLPSHTGQHLYSCQLCGYSAKYRQTLHHHIRTKHPGYTASTIMKGTPCTEIPGTAITESQISNAIATVTSAAVTNECEEYAEEVIIAAQDGDPSLLVTTILDANAAEGENSSVLNASNVRVITTDNEGNVTLPENTIELQIITDDKNVMQIVPSQETTDKAVELLLLAMDPHQTVAEVITEETAETREIPVSVGKDEISLILSKENVETTE